MALSPVGSTYLEGPQNSSASCSVGRLFDSLRVHDLPVRLVDSDGSTVLASADLTGAGEPEELTGVVLPHGSGFLEIGGATADDVQLYSLELTVAALPGYIFAGRFESGSTSAWSSTHP